MPAPLQSDPGSEEFALLTDQLFPAFGLPPELPAAGAAAAPGR